MALTTTVQWQQLLKLSLPRQSQLRQPTTTAVAVVFLADKDKSGPTGDSEHSAAAATATAVTAGDSEQSAGQFGRVVVQCSERVAKSAKAEKKAVKKKAYKKRKAAEKAAAKAARHHQAAAAADGEEDEEEVGFSYSVSYFNWAVSDSESEDSEEGSVRNVTLPLKHLQLKSSK